MILIWKNVTRGLNKMNKDSFKNKINSFLKDKENNKEIISTLIDSIPSNYFEKIVCILENKFEALHNGIDEELERKIDFDFQKIKDGEVVFKCYGVEDGTYSFYDANMDYRYYPTEEMDEILDYTFKYTLSLVYTKNYKRALKYIDLILYTDYLCEEITNPMYSDYEEVIDTFEMNFSDVCEELSFTKEYLYLTITYCVLLEYNEDKFDELYKYLKDESINISDCVGIGIENILNIQDLSIEWEKYKENKK